jgi:sarcosine oxidase subunit gamma
MGSALVVDQYLRQTPLAHLGIASHAIADLPVGEVGFSEIVPAGQLAVRGESNDKKFLTAFADGFGLTVPVVANRASVEGDLTMLWLGPNEWLLTHASLSGPELEYRAVEVLADCRAAVTDVSESRTIIRLTGKVLRVLLAKGCGLDFRPQSFKVGDCPSSVLARCHVTLHFRAEETEQGDTMDVYVHRSFAEYAWNWLRDGAREFGVAVVGA